MNWSSGESSRTSTPSLPEQETSEAADELAPSSHQAGGSSSPAGATTPAVLQPRDTEDPDTSSATNNLVPLAGDFSGVAETEASFARLSMSSGSKGGEPVSREKTISRLLKGKEREWSAVVEKKGPLRLLGLPVDVLQEIITHLPNTNDLTSLALCHSALHRLAIPHIYARFDIVWPPNEDTDDRERAGVDALTYGLATLVMTQELFGEAPWQRQQREKKALSARNEQSEQEISSAMRRRRGNNFAQYTKKFSLGNGPPHWVQEYLITKECGKMLGTLVAIAIAKMHNLEAFVWDMPTGVLREVWLALSSLADREDGEECRLSKVWVRWHDNETASLPPHLANHPVPAHLQPPPPPPPMTTMPPPPPPASGAITQQSMAISAPHVSHNSSSIDRVEHPTFSILPPLKSLSVLDIDEQAYLDELSVLIGRSQECLRELRIGLAKYVSNREWQKVWTGEFIQQVDYSTESTISSRFGEKRLGGVLGTLVGRVYNLNNNEETEQSVSADLSSSAASLGKGASSLAVDSIGGSSSSSTASEGSSTPANAETAGIATPPTIAGTTFIPASTVPIANLHPTLNKKKRTHLRKPAEGPCLSGKLKLETLELERVPLSVVVLQKAIDWSILTTITLLSCQYDDQLWKALRQAFSPRESSTLSKSKAARYGQPAQLTYRLALKKLHVNQVSSSLILFLKETIAPNSLETLFLQEARGFTTNLVTIGTIYKNVIKRQRESLRKLMIDSGELNLDGSTAPSQRWKRWIVGREILDCITSGRMKQLRELGVSIDYRDWHYLLQRLPQTPHLRSLYIPHIADHPHGSNIAPRELAMQILNIVVLRPDIELCYLGIAAKCFEILENKVDLASSDSASDTSSSSTGLPPPNLPGYTGPGGTNVLLDVDDEDDEADTGDDETEVGGQSEDSDEEELSEYDFEEEDGGGVKGVGLLPRLSLREILFYEDKVAIFRGRHGRL